MAQWEISIRADVELASTTGRDYNKADYEGMRKELEEVDWPMLLGSRPMEDAWLRFKRIYNNLEDRYIPMKRSTTCSRKKPKWLNNKAINMVKKKHRVFRKYRRNDHPACVAASRDASSAVRKAKYAFEKKLADNIKSDNKSFYAYARSKSKVKVKPGPLLSDTGRLIDSPQEMSEEFNRYFSSVFTAENVKNMPAAEQMFVGRDEEALLNVVISEGTILEKLKKLREDKAPGDDGIMSRVMHQLQDQLVEPLKLMFEQSMQDGEVPNDWRSANVTPIFKKGSRCQVGNYRPVSLTSQISKLLESIIRDAIVKHLERNELIKSSQHGFRSGRSCLSNLLYFMDNVTKCVERGESVDVIFLDFAKAFDKVPHQRLLQKLQSHGIRGRVWSWVSEWLKNRKQRVCLNGQTSSWLSVMSGVPQGSVLGPILFLVFINDLDSGIINWILKFADDTKLFGPVPDSSARDLLQKELDKLVKWSEDWQMMFSEEKCNYKSCTSEEEIKNLSTQ